MGKNAGLGCKSFYNSLARFLTQRDQAAYYYAFVRLYQIELKASENGEGCLQEPMRSELDKWLKLPGGGLDIVAQVTPGVDVVAVGREGTVLAPADAATNADMALSSTEALATMAILPGATSNISPGSLPLAAVRPEPSEWQ